MSSLRQQMQADMVLHGLAKRTQKVYLSAVTGIATYYHRSPDLISPDEIKQYLLHLINERHLSTSTTNQAGCALKFLYRFTLKRAQICIEIPLRRVPEKLPECLSRQEVNDIIAGCSNLRDRALLMIAYGSGLRLSELRGLKVSDIDTARMMLRVRDGKGGKDRYSLLSPLLLSNLRSYYKRYRPTSWLFPSNDGCQPISQSMPQRLFHAAKRRAHVSKEGGIHSLRHAFATHLIESGVDLPTIKELMGHSHISTTERYLHMQQHHAHAHSPLDLLSGLASSGPA
ncbi:MAG: site-specific integrase [Burkholderiales bacterium]|nr:site-specific integrase [Burkholderiales bacterium]